VKEFVYPQMTALEDDHGITYFRVSITTCEDTFTAYDYNLVRAKSKLAKGLDRRHGNTFFEGQIVLEDVDVAPACAMTVRLTWQ
jgi:hypothetical protein